MVGTMLGLVAALWAATLPIQSPDARYGRFFVGEYATRGTCDQVADRWVLAPQSIAKGPQVCEIASFPGGDGPIRVSLHSCTLHGKPVPSMTMTFDLVSDEVISAADGTHRYLLNRCVD